jgi:dihydrofolate reductase
VDGVVAEISISLDGYVAGPNPTLEEPLGRGGELLHEWAVRLKTFKELHGMEGGDVDADDEVFAEYVHAQGAVVMGRKMFSGGEGPWEDDPKASGWWGDEPPFHKPVFVVTHHEREPLVLGDTTFTFVTGGVTEAVEQARAGVPADRNVLVAGGADTIDQALAAGLVDELQLHVAPVLLGGGTRLFEGLGAERPRLELVAVRESPYVSHLRYRVSS